MSLVVACCTVYLHILSRQLDKGVGSERQEVGRVPVRRQNQALSRMKERKFNFMGCAGRTPLHYAAMHGRVAALEVLVKAGAALNEKDVRGGYTPLHLAADAGQCEAIARLVQLGAPLETRSPKGWTPLALATLKVVPLSLTLQCVMCSFRVLLGVEIDTGKNATAVRT